ncbi:MAG: hypothetical protein F6K42_24260, partial [Leptolyngbya sp. SIO1D8]|nr:hypothetical protein [Leptolyngbya sp. SIO1D8]
SRPNRVELSEKELVAIYGGFDNRDGLTANHNETLSNPTEVTQSKPEPIIELSQEELAEMSGAGLSMNHNETLIREKGESSANWQTETAPIAELSEKDLVAIVGGIGDGCPEHLCGANHNETLVSGLVTNPNS